MNFSDPNQKNILSVGKKVQKNPDQPKETMKPVGTKQKISPTIITKAHH